MTIEERKAMERLSKAIDEVNMLVAKLSSANRRLRNAQIDLRRAQKKASANPELKF